MSKELEHPFGMKLEGTGANFDNEKFEESKKLWQMGEMSSHDFIPIVQAKLLSTHHLFGGGNTTLGDIPPEEFNKQMLESPIINEAAERGRNGERPGEVIENNLGLYLKIRPIMSVKERFLAQVNGRGNEINSRELKNLDEKLPESLPAHLFVASHNKPLYERKKEGVLFSQYRNEVFDNVKDSKQAATILHWLHYKGLMSRLKRFQVYSLLRITEEERFRYCYRDYSHLASGLSTYAHLWGWEQRLKENNSNRDFSLPKFVKTKIAKQTLKSAYFMYEGNGVRRTEVLGQALKSIESTGNTVEIRDKYAQMQAGAIVNEEKRPFPSWELKSLRISKLVKKYVREQAPAHEYLKEVDTKRGIEEELEATEEPEKEPQDVYDSTTKEHKQIPQDGQVTTGIEPSEETEKKEELTEEESPLQQLKDSLEEGGVWSEIELTQYCYALLEGNEALLNSERYPAEINPREDWYGAMNGIGGSVGSYARRIFIGMDKSQNRLTSSDYYPLYPSGATPWTFSGRRNYALERANLDPVIVDIYSDFYYNPSSQDEFIVPLRTVYNFLRDERELPLVGAALGEKNYLMLRASNTHPIEQDESIVDFEIFQRHWLELAGLRVPQNRLEEVFSHRGVSMFSLSTDRREASISACRAHNVVLYESEGNEPFKRIA